MKKKIEVFDYAGHICKAMKPAGILLTTAADGKVNTMTIGWGTIGVDWSRPVFIAYVRESRYTKQLEMYRQGARQLFGTDKVKCILYSFHLGEYTEF